MKYFLMGFLLINTVAALADTCEISTYFYRQGKVSKEMVGEIPRQVIQVGSINECLKLTEAELLKHENVLDSGSVDFINAHLRYASRGNKLDSHAVRIKLNITKTSKASNFYCKGQFNRSYQTIFNPTIIDLSSVQISNAKECLNKVSRRIVDSSEYASDPRSGQIETVMSSSRTGRRIKVQLNAVNLDRMREIINNF